MTKDTFFANFGFLADSPNGVKKLRELILQLAVQGKLVPQDPNDEPAKKLIERIRAEKERLVKEKKIRNSKALPVVDSGEISFQVPDSWILTRLGEIGDWGAGATPDRKKPEYYGGSIQWFKSGELNDNCISNSEEKITDLALQKCSLRLNSPGDVLVAMYGATIGKTAILEVAGTTNQAVCAVTCFTGIFNRFLLMLVKAYKSVFTGQGAGGAQPNISREKIIHTIIPLPPTAEQHRIVAKVDQLMALCDELETRQQKKKQKLVTLNNAALDRLLTARDPNDFANAWRLIRDNFDFLYTAPDTIGKLRQSILQLAVQGKLVPQDPNEEPASALLTKIKADKERLIKGKKIKKTAPLPPVSLNETPFVLPNGWEWVRLGDICNQITDGTHHTPQYVPIGIPFLSVKDVSRGQIDLRNTRFISIDEHKILIKRCNPEYEDILFTKVGTTGIAKVIDVKTEFSIFVSLALIKFAREFIHPFFLEKLLNSPLVKLQSEKYTQGVGNKNLVLKFICAFSIPLPPFAEQHRIVTKVDQLMKLCDELEAKLIKSQTKSEKLVEAVVKAIAAN